MRFHKIISRIVLYRDPRFTFIFWESLQEALWTKLWLSSPYLPQADSRTWRTIQSLEDLLRACVLEQGGSCDNDIPLIEFTYNSSYQSTLGMSPFKALYGMRCKTALCWHESIESVVLGPKIVQQTSEKLRWFGKRWGHHKEERRFITINEGKPSNFQREITCSWKSLRWLGLVGRWSLENLLIVSLVHIKFLKESARSPTKLHYPHIF